ncbi:glycosyl transferase family 2 [Neosynechococcus sphagnicola sy1]|uniref:Glycosyl transferase family 2 n=1 Tax=Neosynechococcus sphagnicola sy1 TaxID=1497020 RepID=A0A098TNU3_9CYAN|nr:glycosyltransferase [Neosynechococcus sphagnicola]KGF73931.1 glycosyl transferase family 2 [Neosynechococcus sphagnicola sy1]
MNLVGLGLTTLSLVIWLGLLLGRGQFWRTDQQLAAIPPDLPYYPTICAVIPARNEADVLPTTLRSLLIQDYPGQLTVILVDDQSSDGTTMVAQEVAIALGKTSQLQILAGAPLPQGWTGKLWAMEQGTRQAQTLMPPPDYLLLTDADIEHDPQNLWRLVAKAEMEQLDLVSLMVKLRCQSFWEQFLIPAFVFFFAKLYPFRWVNRPDHPLAAAAGGCILMRQAALGRIGGLQVLKEALIDDCTLAQQVKSTRADPSRPTGIWLGLTTLTQSLRPYDSLATIWNMVARTAFTQLQYSPGLLVGTLLAMTLIYLLPPLATISGVFTGNWPLALVGSIGWLVMAIAYLPMVRFYGCLPLWAFSLPAIALLYTLMTLDSALRHWRGQGGAWKGRVYAQVHRG